MKKQKIQNSKTSPEQRVILEASQHLISKYYKSQGETEKHIATEIDDGIEYSIC